MIEDVTPALAFPSQPLGMDGLPDHSAVPGMTLRDWFAGQALAGLLASGPHDCDAAGLASDAYFNADAMLDFRAK